MSADASVEQRRRFREAIIDLDAVRANVAHLIDVCATPHAMAIVKADGYGHGAEHIARAALDGGADWLGVADIDEAIQLRDAGIDAPILAWLHEPDRDFRTAVAAGIDLGVSNAHHLALAERAAADSAVPVNVHLKLDTGLSRNGIPEGEWTPVFRAAQRLARDGRLRVRGIFSHLANASASDDAAQISAFERGLRLAATHGLTPELRHLASTAGALRVPEARYDLVRLGIGVYGLSPYGSTVSSHELGLVPVMTVRARVAAVRRVPAGTGASYGFIWRAPQATTLALIPMGYADGIPRQASGKARVMIAGRQHPVVGRIAMDQFIADVGDTPVQVGDEVVVFGDPQTGAPSADDWAEAAGTINYDIVTGIGPRVPRVPSEV